MFNIWEIPFAVTATMADPIEFLKVTAEEAASERSLGADFALWLSMTQKLNVKKKTECNRGLDWGLRTGAFIRQKLPTRLPRK